MIGRILVYSAGAVALAALFWMAGVDDVLEILRNVSPVWIALTTICWISAFVIRGVRWKILLSPIGKPVSFSSSFWSTSMAYMINFVVPTKLGSEVARAVALSRKENISLYSTVSSIAVEKVLDLFIMVMLASGALVFLPPSNFVPDWMFSILKALAVLAFGSMVGLLLVSWRSAGVLDKLKTYSDVLGRVSRSFIAILSALLKGVGWVRGNPIQFLQSFGLTVVLWLVFSVGIYGIFLSFGFVPQPLVILLGALLFSFAHVLPNVPGYVGTYEAVWMLIFFGLAVGSSQVVFAGAIVGHLVSTTITVSLGSIGLVKVGISFTESLRIRSQHVLGPETP